jgi:predicted metal-dependent phosphotriesterase family hydrolase
VRLTIHPPGLSATSQRDRTYPSSRWVLGILDIVEEEGLATEQVIICHLDRTNVEDIKFHKEPVSRGAVIEIDGRGRIGTMKITP